MAELLLRLPDISRRVGLVGTASVRSSAAAGGNAPTDGGTDALDLLTGLFSRIDDAAGRLAEFANAAHVAGLACERNYDALISGR
ncbi:DUF2514 family protein [Pandoraea pulmonicola]|uniref:DUF2514 family protein n=1 Tax=Pandoraea pulmonicola TaxID=93221 RepID=UPI00093507A0